MTRVARVLLSPYLVGLLLITWLPGDQAGEVTGIVATIAELVASQDLPFEQTYAVLEFLANVALFVPLGLLLGVGWPRPPWWAVTIAGGLLSMMIELVQTTLPTRFPTVSDVIANTLGTLLGVAVVRAVHRRRAAPHTLEA